jgi:hypothetical protein
MKSRGSLRPIHPPTEKREAYHSPASVAEVKNDGAIPPLHETYSCLGAKLIKPRDKFTF